MTMIVATRNKRENARAAGAGGWFMPGHPFYGPFRGILRTVQQLAKALYRAPGLVSPQLNVCNLSFSVLSAWRSNTCTARPEKFAGLPSLSLPLALQFAVL
jgi:hypothetical protein